MTAITTIVFKIGHIRVLSDITNLPCDSQKLLFKEFFLTDHRYMRVLVLAF